MRFSFKFVSWGVANSTHGVKAILPALRFAKATAIARNTHHQFRHLLAFLKIAKDGLSKFAGTQTAYWLVKLPTGIALLWMLKDHENCVALMLALLRPSSAAPDLLILATYLAVANLLHLFHAFHLIVHMPRRCWILYAAAFVGMLVCVGTATTAH